MSYRYLEDIATADVAFEATGADLPDVFRSAAAAAMGVMVEDLATIRPQTEVSVEFSGADLDMLLFDLLNELVYYKDAKGLLLVVGSISVDCGQKAYALKATLKGEKIDRARHRLKADVKAVTLHRLSLVRVGPLWRATVVLDI